MLNSSNFAVKAKGDFVWSSASVSSVICKCLAKFNRTKGWVVAMVGYRLHQVGTYSQPFVFGLYYKLILHWAIFYQEIAQWSSVECGAFNLTASFYGLDGFPLLPFALLLFRLKAALKALVDCLLSDFQHCLHSLF